MNFKDNKIIYQFLFTAFKLMFSKTFFFRKLDWQYFLKKYSTPFDDLRIEEKILYAVKDFIPKLAQ